MRAAIRWAYSDVGQEALGKQVAEQIVLQKEVRRVKANPTRADVEAFVSGAKGLEHPWRELLIVGVSIGLRREELLTLDRHAIEKSMSGDKILRFIRKGALEHELPVEHVLPQFKALLRLPASRGRGASLDAEASEWEVLWQVAGSSYRAAYEKLKRKVKSVAKAAGCSSEWTPHVMRHAFASEMVRDGASLPHVQEALNHSSYQTSLRYIHVDAADLKPWMKPRGGE
ncbi:MAG: site-specific integrase [Minisyncoccia bacterium]